MNPEEVLAEAKWQLSPDRERADWRAPPERSPQGDPYVGDFGDAGELVEQLTDALEAVLNRLHECPPSREVKAMNLVLRSVACEDEDIELQEAITVCKRWLAT